VVSSTHRHAWGALALVLGLGWATATGWAQDGPSLNTAHEGSAHDSDVSCATCHDDAHEGAVGDACDSCHTSEAWSPSLFDAARHAATDFPLEGQHAEQACAECHPSGKLAGLPLECSGCHVDRHRGKLGGACADCHSVEGFVPVEGFDHAERTGFALAGVHQSPSCDDCHDGDNGRALRLTMEPGCDTCHTAGHGDFDGRACDSCHALNRDSFASAKRHFDHRPTGFDLERRHRATSCASCHPKDGADPQPRCASCHTDVHNGQAGRVCADCHRPDRWSLVRFDHNLALWPLRGKHFVVPCLDCHRQQQWVGLRGECIDCHFSEAARGPATIPAHIGGPAECTDCHVSLWSWEL